MTSKSENINNRNLFIKSY